jgi:hypothetical protein
VVAFELRGELCVQTVESGFFECFGVPGDEAAGFSRPAVIAKPACASSGWKLVTATFLL